MWGASGTVIVSWNALIILDISIFNYTVLYSPASGRRKRQSEEAVFPSSATFGIIDSLRPGTTYQFQVYATVEVDGAPLPGDPSPVTDDSMVRLEGENLQSQVLCISVYRYCSHNWSKYLYITCISQNALTLHL